VTAPIVDEAASLVVVMTSLLALSRLADRLPRRQSGVQLIKRLAGADGNGDCRKVPVRRDDDGLTGS